METPNIILLVILVAFIAWLFSVGLNKESKLRRGVAAFVRSIKRQRRERAEARAVAITEAERNGLVYCPKCGSTQLVANENGFGVGKAAAGGCLLGPIGLLGGFIGSKKIVITCLKCGYQWNP